MSSVLLGFILDVVVLIFLGAMIFYAMRLSNSLNAFRKHREDFDQIITSLVTSINQAEKAIHNLKETGQNEAGHIEALIKESKNLSEELKIINDASDSMAKRLETLAEKNSKIMQGIDIHKSSDVDVASKSVGAPSLKSEGRKKSKVGRTREKVLRAKKPAYSNEEIIRGEQGDLPSFIIEDRDYEREESLEGPRGPAPSNDAPHGIVKQEEEGLPHFQSQAERELYDALQKKVPRRRGSGA